MITYVNQHGEIVEDNEATKAANSSKASFKLDMIETVNADPQMQPSDLALVAAHLCVMKWPKRTAWLSISQARARTGLSERQIINSRARIIQRGYFKRPKSDTTGRIFTMENPRREAMRMHVDEAASHLKVIQAERQAERRRIAKAVSANSAGTEDALSQSPSDCDVPANSAGYYPYTPQEEALEKEDSLNLSEGTSAPDHPYPVPETESELTETLASLFAGCALSPAVLVAMRGMLLTGKLTPAIVEQQRIFAS